MKSDKLFNLSGRIAVVTGGMGQLGVEYSMALAERGVKVAVFDMTKAPRIKNPRFMKEIKAGRIRPFRVDITNRSSIADGLTSVRKQWGCPHILVNNAAIDSPPDAPAADVGPFENYPEASFDKVMAVNVKGTLLCCQLIGKEMAKAGRGSIINISSTYGILSPCQDIYEFRRKKGETFFKPVAYSVSKSAILNLTRYLATYWAKKGVRVNTLTPAGIFNKQPKEFLKAYCSRTPIGRMALAGEMTGAIVFLASDASSYMTGSNLVIDGGWSAW
jgi:NAD(P)-dependent dehydrogenase (short-subunit alcohol dehydrogenase family)